MNQFGAQRDGGINLPSASEVRAEGPQTQTQSVLRDPSAT